jgi:hypothetical protein
VLGHFIEARCLVGSRNEARAGELSREYKEWTVLASEYELNDRGFRMARIGLRVGKPSGYYYHGIAIADWLPDPATNETDDRVPF